MKELFKSIDTDNSGTISVAEMRNALAHWGHRYEGLVAYKVVLLGRGGEGGFATHSHTGAKCNMVQHGRGGRQRLAHWDWVAVHSRTGTRAAAHGRRWIASGAWQERHSHGGWRISQI